LKSKSFVLLIMLVVYTHSLAFAVDLDPEKFMTTDKIKPGMKGIGKTVFSGTKVEEFQIEVLDILKNGLGPKSDVIWVLCSGGPLAETGVMQGMSGSPIYIDNKLVGAVAYTFSYSKKPIAGITPIADMLSIIGKDSNVKSKDIGMIDDLDILFPNSEFANEDKDKQWKFDNSESNTLGYEKIQNPIMMSGFSTKTIEYISPMLKKYGMTPIQGGGGGSRGNLEDIKIEPGSVIGIQFVRGDYNAFGYGTVTYIDEKNILAFGHPMSGLGPIELPASIGEVNILRPSLVISSKLASPVKTVGTLTYDSQYGIMINTEKQPEYIPMKIKIRTQGNNYQEFNFEILKNKLFAPSFIASTAMDVVLVATKQVGDYTMKTHAEANIKGYPKIVMDNIYSGQSTDIFLSDFANPFFAIMRNRFEEVDIENILLEIDFEDKRTNASIDNITINKSTVKPGDSIDISMSITPYLQETIKKEFSITVPSDVPEGRALLRISNASASMAWENARAPRKSIPVSVSHIIKQLQESEMNDNIIVEIFVPKTGMTVKGEELPALPLTAISIIDSSNQAGNSTPTLGTTFLKERIKTDYVLIGNAVLLLTIDQNAP